MSYYPVTVQQLDPTTETWADYQHLHAVRINRAGGGESFGAAADQYHQRLMFDLYYCSALADVARRPQQYRLIYCGQMYNIVDVDDYMERHITLRLTGEAYG